MWSILKGLFGSNDNSSTSQQSSMGHDDGCDINPATGLPMIGGCGGIDVEGNPYGTDLNDDYSSTSSWDDFSTSSFDDSWSSLGNDDWTSSSSWND
ncbi:hypothetical protein [Candidatus Igneacidithiobacillus taiwanensis]|uniref:hypothetical protein n=1 Tax=Candidatus Igneacidithiobacillus taiwanensis TaxID=1945924 RepID=UPI0028A0B8EA|nr:hypothetical protein [Candidatus Igneacidithiobacillus taiwanensis]MCE5361478.1 hypothetical protein [Acidithiobacillus sp.]